MTEKTLILVSELWQIDKLGITPNGTVVALNTEIEESLYVRGISYISAREYRTPNLDFRDEANKWTKEILENPEKPFVEYRGISLGRIYFYPLFLYFTRVAYWLDIIASLIEHHPDVTALVVYQSAFRVAETTGDLGQEEINALVDSAKLIGAQKDIKIVLQPAPPETSIGPSTLFFFKRKCFGYLLNVWSACMSLRRTRSVRILASDYWRNIGPVISHLPDSEVVFIDRLQAFQAGISNMWKWHMRFYHLDHFSNSSSEKPNMGMDVSFTESFRGYDIGPLISSTRRALIQNYVPKALRDIDGAYAMLKKLRPSVILLRVSTAPQRHYAILAMVGRIIGIPSVEFQHGLEYNGPDSSSRRKNAQYIGVYGRVISDELISAGIENERVKVIGSPRFDIYAQERKQHKSYEEYETSKKFSILCIYPDLSYGDDGDSYDIDTFMRGVADAVRGINGAHLTIKLRGPRSEAFSRRSIAQICKDIPHTVVRDIPLQTLFKTSDVVVSCYSTAMLEAMQSGISLIFFAYVPLQERLSSHFDPYLRAGALEIVRSSNELASALHALENAEARRALVERADRFISEAYKFDGRSADRAAKFIRELAQGK